MIIDGLIKILSEVGITNTIVVTIILLVVGFLALLIIVNIIKKPFRRPKLIAYSTDKGSVQVSHSAISDLIQSICSHNSNLSQLKSKIFTQRKKLHIQIRLRIESGSHLRTIEEAIQSNLRAALNNSLGISDVGSIDIIATGIKESANSSKIASEDSDTNR